MVAEPRVRLGEPSSRDRDDLRAITERLLKDLTRLGDRVWLVVDDVHELGPADAGRHLELLVMRGPLEASSCSAQELTAPDTEQSSHRPRVP